MVTAGSSSLSSGIVVSMKNVSLDKNLSIEGIPNNFTNSPNKIITKINLKILSNILILNMNQALLLVYHKSSTIILSSGLVCFVYKSLGVTGIEH